MKVKDYFKSKEEFELIKNPKYNFLETQPRLEWKELINYYDSERYISHQEKSTSALSSIYNLIKKYMFHKKESWINQYVKEGHILDFGAGTGEFLDFLPDKSWDKTALEPNTKAQGYITKKDIEVVSSFDKLVKQFDVITAWHALEHVLDLDKWFKGLQNITNNGSYVFVAVPNYKSYDANYYGKYWAAYDVPRHQHHFTKQSLINLFNDNGYRYVNEHCMPFDAFYVSIKSEVYKKSNNVIKGICIGLKSNILAIKNKECSSNCLIFKKIT